MLRVGVLISGGGTNLQSLIDSANDTSNNFEIVAVVSNRSGAYGLKRAKNASIPNYFVSKKDFPDREDYDREIIRIFDENRVEFVVLAGYLNILTEMFINEYANRIINIHPSLLPSFGGSGFYGERVHSACIERGVKVSGATVHFVSTEVDGGPIILQEAVEVKFSDTVETLQKRVLEVEHRLLPKAVKLYAAGKLKVTGNRVEVSEVWNETSTC